MTTYTVYHVTNEHNADDIIANGFDLDRCGSGVGSVLGAAIYVTQDAGETLEYYQSSDNTVTLAGTVTLSNPFVIEAPEWMHEDVLHNEIAEALYIYADTVADILRESDHDGIVIEQPIFDRKVGGSQIIVLDPALVTMTHVL